ncbi:MAG: glycosyltransferase, partial [Nocardioidaceae bacterium]
MKVLVNALPLRYGGGVTHVEQQLRAVARVAPEVELHTLVSPWTQIRELPGTVETVPLSSVPQRYLYEQLRLPRRGADVLYCPANFGPVVPTRAPMVLTIHNAHYYRSGLAMPETRSLRPAWKVKANHLAMKRADTVVAVSQVLAEDAAVTVPGVAGKVHVIPCGSPEWPASPVPVGDLPERYILTLASPAAHKRVIDVVTGWARSLDRGGGPVGLVVVGELTEQQRSEHRAAAGRHAQHLFHLGQIGDRAELRWLYENALAMVSMSILESLALTPIEAGSLGCPVVLTDIPAHREATQGHGAFVPTGDTAALATALAAGYGRWKPGSEPWDWETTWDDHARALLEVFETARRGSRAATSRPVGAG